jgi:hypothetical protein
LFFSVTAASENKLSIEAWFHGRDTEAGNEVLTYAKTQSQPKRTLRKQTIRQRASQLGTGFMELMLMRWKKEEQCYVAVDI